jgi:hypothetical protein
MTIVAGAPASRGDAFASSATAVAARASEKRA